MHRRHAFTLVELLVVMAIISVLAAMAMPLVGLARDAARRTATESVLRATHTALRLFQRDARVLPWQAQPDAGPQGNGLARRLGRTPTAAQRDALNAAVGAAAAKYAYDAVLDPYAWSEAAVQPSPLTIRRSHTERVGRWDGSSMLDAGVIGMNGLSDRTNPVGFAWLVNRLFMQRARHAVLAGIPALPGPLVSRPGDAVPVADLSGVRLLAPAEGTADGWSDDYLEGAVAANRIKGDDICDAWGRPIVVVCQVLPRIQAASTMVGHGSYGAFDTGWFGLGTVGFEPGTGPWSSLVAAGRSRLISQGRIRLAPADAGDGRPTPADAVHLPDPAAPFASDRRFYAVPGMESDAELWSAGREGTFAWRRDAAANRSAIPFSKAYDRGLR